MNHRTSPRDGLTPTRRASEDERNPRWRVGLVWLVALLSGCGHPPGPAANPSLPVIPVSRPVQRQVTDFVDYTGRTDAVQSVAVRARVTGYLVKMPFQEGSEVKRGEPLFEIDPRPYQAQYDAAQAQINLYQAQRRLAQSNYQRDLTLAPNNISAQQLDYDRAAVQEAEAQIKLGQANLENYRLNLEFTKVTSPINGQVSRYYYTLGNLVTQDQTLLTTIVSLDPMYVYFDMDERTVLRIRKDVNKGKIPAAKTLTVIPVNMGLEGEDDYPHHGHLDFVNNAVNPSTGTIAVRGVFANPKPSNGRRLLSPGMFARIRLPVGPPHPALLVVDRAITTNQAIKIVYVVDAEHKVQERRVTTGALQDDGLRVIETGLTPDDWVVVGGLQQVRPRMEVEPDEMAMPAFGAGGQAAPEQPAKPQAATQP
jgi:multidrug efflux system membrane fusion protein